MAVTIHCNGTCNSLVHKGNSGFTQSTLPDVCKTPSPGGPVPIPYPVIVSLASDLDKGSTTVKIDGDNMVAIKGSEFSRCTGDEPGTAGGVKSSTNMKEATWVLYSFDVKVDGQNACRFTDKMMMNHGNAACLAGHITKPVGMPYDDSKLWDECTKEHDKYKATQKKQAEMIDDEYNGLRDQVFNGGATKEETGAFVFRLQERLILTRKLHGERKKYIDMGCDKFDWDSDYTQAEREQRHRDELGNVGRMVDNLQGEFDRANRILNR
jgi:hypothetical protein